jgi:hypothetical protein
MSDMRETVAFSGQMLDAGYLMLDIQECIWKEIQKHPVSRISQYLQWFSSQRPSLNTVSYATLGLILASNVKKSQNP